MLNFLVETKNEYTTHLTNILTPLIFEGIQSIYKEAMEIAGTNDILKIYQSFLKRIPKWNQLIIEKETDRIINSSHSFGWLNDLIKATLKSNILILMYNPSNKHQKIDSKYYKNIKTTDFIHRIYIECAREIWNNPYLMYHLYPPIEIKRNQRECMNIIKDCIKEAIRKLLPVKHILDLYLGDDVKINTFDNNFDKTITEEDEYNLKKLIKKDLSNNNNIITYKNMSENNTDKTIGSTILKIINQPNYKQKSNYDKQSDKKDIIDKQSKSESDKKDIIDKQSKSESDKKDIIDKQSKSKSESDKKDIINKQSKSESDSDSESESDIKDIINKQYETASDSNKKSKNDKQSEKNNITNSFNNFENKLVISNLLNKNNNLSDNLDNLETSSIDNYKDIKNKNNKISNLVKNSNSEYSIDDKIKQILKDDLHTINSDLETSLNYTNDNNYKEIFSNSNIDNQKTFFKQYNNI